MAKNKIKVIAEKLISELKEDDLAELVIVLNTARTISAKIRQALSEDEHKVFVTEQAALKAQVNLRPEKGNASGPKRWPKRKARMDTANLPPRQETA